MKNKEEILKELEKRKKNAKRKDILDLIEKKINEIKKDEILHKAI